MICDLAWQAREAREREELQLSLTKRVGEAEEAHKGRMAVLKKEHEELEDKIKAQVSLLACGRVYR